MCDPPPALPHWTLSSLARRRLIRLHRARRAWRSTMRGITRCLAPRDLRSQIQRSRHDAWASPYIDLVLKLLDDGDGAIEEILTSSYIYISK
jgi:hypothetical protein